MPNGPSWARPTVAATAWPLNNNAAPKTAPAGSPCQARCILVAPKKTTAWCFRSRTRCREQAQENKSRTCAHLAAGKGRQEAREGFAAKIRLAARRTGPQAEVGCHR